MGVFKCTLFIISSPFLTLQYNCCGSISSKSLSDFIVKTWTVPSRRPIISSGFPSPIKSKVSRQVMPQVLVSVSTKISFSTRLEAII